MKKQKKKFLIKVVASANNTIAFPSYIKKGYDEERKVKQEIASGNTMLDALDNILENLSELVTLPNGQLCHKDSISKHGFNIVNCGE